MRVSGHPRTQANETTNETAAGAGGLTPASPARELLLRLTRGEPARQSRRTGRSRWATIRQRPDGITLSNREVRGEGAHSRVWSTRRLPNPLSDRIQNGHYLAPRAKVITPCSGRRLPAA